MELLQAFILGMVQGLGEFLPISSSAHLILTPYLFNWTDQGLAFDIALHWGTLLAVIAYFYKDLWHMVKGFINSLFPSTRDLENNPYQKLSWLVLIATIPAAVIGKIFEEQVETVFRSPLIIAANLSIVGVLLLLADKYGHKLKTLTDAKKGNALLIGIAQALAIIPGISRSGATITAGLLQGFTRADAAKFSFLMSVPIILGAGVLKIPEITAIDNQAQVLVGFISSTIFGFLSIKFLLKYIASKSFAIFTYYRLGLAAVIVIVYLTRG